MLTSPSATFGELLRHHRQTAGLTQQELAERAGLSVHGIQKLERGATHPYRDTAQRLIAALHLDADDQACFRAAVVPMRRHGSGHQPEAPTDERHNLPALVTRLIGRDRAVREVAQKMSETRLLTLTGVGGCGKTRLALEVGRGMLGSYADGVWLVELGPLVSPAAVAPRVAGALGIREIAEQPLSLTLVNALRHRRLLLVLDNCEHLLDACAELVDALLRACPELRILATSREPIGIVGEVAWRVPSLAVPEATATVEQLSSSPSVQLFVERATAVQPRFALTAVNAGAVAQICQRLDGIPLALELAAARIDSLTPEQIALRLDQRFRLLTGGSRSALPRQQTLMATLDWSYDLLRKPERSLLQRLAVFSGGWTLEAAEGVCADGDVDSQDVLDLLAKLTRKSLVIADAMPEGAVRYVLLETVRDYAHQKLSSRGSFEFTALRDRHATFYAAWVAHLLPIPLIETWFGTAAGLNHALLQVDAEYDNIRLMYNWCLESNQPAPGIRVGIRLHYFAESRGLYADQLRWLEALLGLPYAAGDRADAVQPVERALAVFLVAACYQRLGACQESRRRYEESIVLLRELGENLPLATALAERGLVGWLLGDSADAVHHLHESRRVLEQCDSSNPLTVASDTHTLRNLGIVARSEGGYERAAEYFRESVRRGLVASSSGGYLAARGLSHLARTQFLQGDIREARRWFGEALQIMSADRLAGHSLADCLDWLAAVADADGRPRNAAVLFGAADAQWQASGAIRYAPERARYAAEVVKVQAKLSAAEFASAWADGQAMGRERAVDFAVQQTRLSSPLHENDSDCSAFAIARMVGMKTPRRSR